MSQPITFIDTETTSLRYDRSIWEVGAIRVDPDGTVTEWSAFMDLRDVDLGGADPYALGVGKFHERHPDVVDVGAPASDPHRGLTQESLDEWVKARHALGEVLAQHAMARRVEELTRGAILVASNPAFDTETLAFLLRRHNLCPTWHYRPLDVATLAAGYLLGRLAVDPGGVTDAGLNALAVPWKSEALALAIGVEPAPEAERHTALGDARWVRRCWDLLMADNGA